MDNSREISVTVVGAIVGGAVAYLFFTEHGSSLRRKLEPALDDISRELNSFRTTMQKATGVANEGWRLLNDTLGEPAQPQPSRFPTAHQTSPF